MLFERCEKCGQVLVDPVNKIADRAQSAPKKYVDVPEAWFNTKCYTLLRLPEVENRPKFKDALIDLPKALKRWGHLTEGQYKFFCVIHNELTGSWPSRESVKEQEEPPPF